MTSSHWPWVALVGACVLRPPVSVPAEETAPVMNAALAAIPYEASGSTVVLSVSVNGSMPKPFILDTGANSCVLNHGLADALKLVPASTGEGTGAGAGPVPYRRYAATAARFAVGGLEFRCEHVISLDLSNQPAILGRAVDGILGSDFISQFVVEIDYDAEVVRLHDAASFHYDGAGEAIALQFERRLPYVTATLEVAGLPPTPRRLLLDSGSEDAVDDDLILRSTGPRRATTGGVGLGQTYKVVLGWVNRLRLGRHTIERLPSVAPGVALIGGEVLRRFRVILDYRRQRLILEPGAHLRDAYRPDCSGLNLRLADDGDGLLVEEVHERSPAGRAGLRAGHRILTVDGVDARQLGLRRVQRLLAAPGVRYRLRSKSSEGSSVIDLQTRREDCLGP